MVGVEFPHVSAPRASKATKVEWPTGNVPRRRKTILDYVGHTQPEHRVLRAIRMDNGGRWFLAYSKYPVTVLEARFRQESVAQVLYERVGGILQGPDNYIYLQITCYSEHFVLVDEHIFKEVCEADKPDWAVQLALRDIGVFLDTEVSLLDIKNSGLF